MRLVVIRNRTYAVYENKQCIAVFELEEGQRPLFAQEVEELRLAEYKDLA